MNDMLERIAQQTQQVQDLLERHGINQSIVPSKTPEPVQDTHGTSPSPQPTVAAERQEAVNNEPSHQYLAREPKRRFSWKDMDRVDLGWTQEDEELLRMDEDQSSDEETNEAQSFAQLEKEKRERQERMRRKLEFSQHFDSRQPRWRLMQNRNLTDDQIDSKSMQVSTFEEPKRLCAAA